MCKSGELSCSDTFEQELIGNNLTGTTHLDGGDAKNALIAAAFAEGAGDLATRGVSEKLPDLAGCNSFVGTTQVLLADGSSKPIDQIKVGDQIANALPGVPPGTPDQKHAVTAVHVTYTDREYTNVTVQTDHGPAVIVGTAHHLYWDATTQIWTEADNLKVGDQLQTDNGAEVAIAALRDYVTTDVTYNLTIDSVHTYYVLAGNTPVLVHNGGPGCGSLWIDPNKIPHHYMRASDAGDTHAEDFGISGPYNKANSSAFVSAIGQFVRTPDTQVIGGTFRGQAAIHYVNPATGLHASFAADGPNVGEYLGGWKSTGDQLSYLLRNWTGCL